MDIQIPYSKNYAELIKSHDIIIESLGELENSQYRSRGRQSKAARDDYENLKILAWGINIVLKEDVKILRALEKEDEKYVDAFNRKLKEI